MSKSDVFVTYSSFMNNTAQNSNTIYAGRSVVYCKGDTFNNESSFVPSWDEVYGNYVFISISIQNAAPAFSSMVVPVIDYTEAMVVDPKFMHYKTNTEAMHMLLVLIVLR